MSAGPANSKQAHQHVDLDGVHNGLRKLAELCSQAIAAMHTDNGSAELDLQNLMDINRAVWELLWEPWGVPVAAPPAEQTQAPEVPS